MLRDQNRQPEHPRIYPLTRGVLIYNTFNIRMNVSGLATSPRVIRFYAPFASTCSRAVVAQRLVLSASSWP